MKDKHQQVVAKQMQPTCLEANSYCKNWWSKKQEDADLLPRKSVGFMSMQVSMSMKERHYGSI